MTHKQYQEATKIKTLIDQLEEAKKALIDTAIGWRFDDNTKDYFLKIISDSFNNEIENKKIKFDDL